jgi:transposase
MFKLYPTPDQDKILREQAAMCADLWNALLEMCETRFRHGVQGRSFHCAACAALFDGCKVKLCEAHKLPSEFDMGYWITDMLAQCPEWRALSTWTPRRVANSLSTAWQGFFRRLRTGGGDAPGYPRYKSRRRHFSIPHRAVSGCTLAKSPRHQKSWCVKLKGIPDTLWARGRFPGEVVKHTNVDIKFDGIDWCASVACVLDFSDPRHRGGSDSVDVKFDLIDGFATVNEQLETPDGLAAAARIEEYAQERRSEFDTKWPRGKRLTAAELVERQNDASDITRLRRKAARIRKNALHVWSSQTVGRAATLTVHDPAIKKHLKTPHGDRTNWGAATKEVSALNRAVTNYSAGAAVAMLTYKAEEAGIKFSKQDDPTPTIAIGAAMVGAGKTLRRITRKIHKGDHASTS